jgi:hypothetical protein
MPDIKRINVAVTPQAVEALELVIEREGVDLHEAHRRLIAYGALVYRTIAVDGHRMVIHDGGCDREVILS